MRPIGPRITPVSIYARIAGCLKNRNTIANTAAIQITMVNSKNIFSTGSINIVALLNIKGK
jgi:hypothetical protein